jgi:hypothetical protein
MSEKAKAIEMYDKFHVYEWDENEGYQTSDKETKKMVNNIIDEIELQARNWGVSSVKLYWQKVRAELNAL